MGIKTSKTSSSICVMWWVHLPKPLRRAHDDHEPMCWRFLQELLFSHNIGVDRQKRQRQKLTDSARSVGLTLPDFSQ